MQTDECSVYDPECRSAYAKLAQRGGAGDGAGAGRDQGQRRLPGFTKTNLNNYAGTETVEEGAGEAVRVALLGPDGPTGTFTHAKLGTLPW